MDAFAPAERTLISLKVTNHNDFTIEDKFDGVPYVFEPERAVSVPQEAALHMLGWFPGVDLGIVKNHVQRRWGWNTPDLVKDKTNDKYFAQLSFKPVSYKIVEVPEMSETEGDELPNPLKKPKKNGNTTLEASA